MLTGFYSSIEIHSTGQTSAQEPQSVQSSGSITYISPSEIASTGHSSIHVPHAIHSSEITYAITNNFIINMYKPTKVRSLQKNQSIEIMKIVTTMKIFNKQLVIMHLLLQKTLINN